MEIDRLIPLRDDISAGFLTGLDDGPGVWRIVRVDVDGAVPASLGEDCLDVSDAFFAVAFGHQCDVLSANGLGEGSASRIPCGVIRVGKRANGIDEGRHIGRISATRDDRRKHSHGGDGGRTLQKLTTL
ncbi:MAG: hypothetical protein JW395_2826 [Nitrospira sp.]|nr:hypothetical protein [Nitrospira sp.]